MSRTFPSEFGNDVLLEQLSIPIPLARRIPISRSRTLQGGVDTIELRLIRRRIERRDDVALLDLVAGLDTPLQHPAAHSEGERGLVRRSCLTRYRPSRDDVGIDDAECDDGPWRHLGFLGRLVAASAQQK